MLKTTIAVVGIVAIVGLIYIGARYGLSAEYLSGATSVISGVIGFALGRPSRNSR